MRFSWIGLVLFALGLSSVLLLIAVCDKPLEGNAGQDGWTAGSDQWSTPGAGERPSRATAAGILAEARALGDVQKALELTIRRRDQVADPANLVRIREHFREELTTANEAAASAEEAGQPSPALIARNEALARLARWREDSLDIEEILALLTVVQMDEKIARKIEGFFLPSVSVRKGLPNLPALFEKGCPPDRLAALAQASQDDGIRVASAEECRIVAAAFARSARPRARVRWLLRAVSADPSSAEAALELANALIESGAGELALTLLSATARAGATSLEFDERRLEFSRWFSAIPEEIDALEALLTRQDDTERRERLVALYKHLNRLEEAARHVAHLSRLDGDAQGLGDAARLALEAENFYLAYDLLDEASRLAPDPRLWREFLLSVYLADMELNMALDELRALTRDWPDDGYDRELMSLLRRTGHDDELAEMILARLSEADPETEAEALALCIEVGRGLEALALLTRRMQRIEDPRLFFRSLQFYSRLAMEGLVEKTFEIVMSDRFARDVADNALFVLLTLADNPAYEQAIRAILFRYPESVADPEPDFEPEDAPPAWSHFGLDEKDWRTWFAERFFSMGWFDLSQPLYEGIAEAEPENAEAWLRVGQMQAWSTDPYQAVWALERAYALGGPGDGELPFLLGEAYWATKRFSEARAMHELGLELLSALECPDSQARAMLGKIKARLGDDQGAKEAYESLIHDTPDSQDLLIDYADALIVLGELDQAAEILGKAKELGPEEPRVLRMESQVRILEHRFEDALVSIDHAIELYGEDLGYSLARSDALLCLGRLADAAASYDDVLRMDPRNRSAIRARRELGDQLASPIAAVDLYTASIGDDDILRARVQGSWLIDIEKTRLSGMIETGSYEGAALAYEDGRDRVSADITTLSLALSRTLGRSFEIAAGPDLHLDRPGDDPVGGFAEVTLKERKPYGRFQLRAHLLETMIYPASAVGLEGRNSGVELLGYRSGSDADWWAYGRLGYSRLSIETEGDGRISDGLTRLEASVGTWFANLGPQVQESLLARRAEPIRVGSTVAGEQSESEGPRISGWLAYSGMRLLDGADLVGPLPLTERADYVTLTGRWEDSLTTGVIVEIEAYLGTDLADPGLFAGGLLGITWRPREEFDVRLRGTYGQAFARTDGEEGATSLELTFTIRW
jgi:tetratricopeptide (TPR) repeat protein